jgi:hypothetical protein
MLMYDREWGATVGGSKSIGGAGLSWSGGTTESSLSLINNLGWCLISCLQFERLRLFFAEQICGRGTLQVEGLNAM